VFRTTAAMYVTTKLVTRLWSV